MSDFSSPPQSRFRFAQQDSSPIKGERKRLSVIAKKLRRNMTIEESLVWQDIKRLPEFRFRRQAVIVPYIVDFACFKTKIIIELDGAQHAESEHKRKDRIRDKAMSKEGFEILRFWNPQNDADRDSIVDSLYGVLRARSPLMGELAAKPTEGVT